MVVQTKTKIHYAGGVMAMTALAGIVGKLHEQSAGIES